MRWLPVHLGQLAPATLPQCRLVSNTRSATLSLSLSRCLSISLFLSLWPSPHSLSLCDPPLSLSLCDPLCDPLSFSRIKGFFGMSGGSLSPPGFEPSSTGQKRCAIPTVLRSDAFRTVALTCSALYLCLPLSLSLCVSLSLSLLPLRTNLPLPTGREIVFFFGERFVFICCSGIIVRRDLQQCESLSTVSKCPNASPRI